MTAIYLHNSVYDSFDIGFYLNKVQAGNTSVLKTSPSFKDNPADLVRLAKKCLEHPFPFYSNITLEQKKNFFVRLCELDRAYIKSIDNSVWITVVHVLLLILTLGIFSFQNSLKSDTLSPNLENFLGSDNKETSQRTIALQIPVQVFAQFSPELRTKIAQELHFEKWHEEHEKNHEYDKIPNDPAWDGYTLEWARSIELTRKPQSS